RWPVGRRGNSGTPCRAGSTPCRLALPLCARYNLAAPNRYIVSKAGKAKRRPAVTVYFQEYGLCFKAFRQKPGTSGPAALALQEISTHVRLLQTSRLQAHGIRVYPQPAPHTAMACFDVHGSCAGIRRPAVPAEKLWPHPPYRRAVRTAALRPEQRQYG